MASSRALGRSGDETFKLSLTPMIDVTFQLLIFFMVATEFSDRFIIESTMKAAGIIIGEPGLELRIRLDSDTESTAGSPVRIMFEQYRCENIQDLKAKLKILREDLSSVPIVIDGAPDIAFENVLATLGVCKDAEYSNVKFARPRPGALD